jgi:hypothetical protein
VFDSIVALNFTPVTAANAPAVPAIAPTATPALAAIALTPARGAAIDCAALPNRDMCGVVVLADRPISPTAVDTLRASRAAIAALRSLTRMLISSATVTSYFVNSWPTLSAIRTAAWSSRILRVSNVFSATT